MKSIEVYTADLADRTIRYAFRYSGTERYMHPYLKQCEDTQWDILADQAYIERQRPYYTECTEDGYVEYKSLIGLTSLFLLPKGCCVFHGAAFIWKERAWIITAPSGTGKTTQYKNWKILYGPEVEMICGDMPILDFDREDGIWVHPSPWNGKERLKGSGVGKLGGIVYLEQGKNNVMERWRPEESVVPILQQFAVSPETKEDIRLLERMEDKLLKRVPVWKFVNTGDRSSSELMRSVFESWLSEENNEIPN